MTNGNNIALRIQLVLARIEILKLKANDHDWQCYVPEDVRDSLDKELITIDALITALNQSTEQETK